MSRQAESSNTSAETKITAMATSQHAERRRFYAAIRYQPAVSAEDAAVWACRNNLAGVVDYANLPTWAANECNRKVLEALSEFPALREQLEFLGSNLASARMERARAATGIASWLAEREPRQSAVQIEREARRRSLGTFRRAWGYASHYVGLAFRSPVSGISVKYRGGGGSAAVASLRRTVDHELGHLLDGMLAIQCVPIIRRLAIEWPPAATARELGRYANKNESEFVAVAWESFRNDAEPGTLARTVGLEVVEQYKRRFVA